MNKSYIFNIGLNKCGTTSLASALNILGIRTLHHNFKSISNNKNRDIRLVDFWRHNLRNGRRPFYGLDNSFYGFGDFFGEACFKQLDLAYPGSKFILTTRPLDEWLASRERHVNKNLQNPKYLGGFREVNIQGWTNLYNSHISHTREYFRNRKNDFLIMDIPSGDGWDKLCQFLSLPTPSIEFPWGNKSEKYD